MAFLPHPDNGHFENGLGTWVQTHPFSPIALDTGFSHGGNNSLKIELTGATNAIGARIQATSGNEPYQIVPHPSDDISGWFYASSVVEVASLYVVFYDGDVVEIFSVEVQKTNLTPNAWSFIDISRLNVPADAVYFSLIAAGLKEDFSNLPLGTEMWWDDFNWEDLEIVKPVRKRQLSSREFTIRRGPQAAR